MAEKSDVIISMLATPSTTEEVILGTGEWQGVGVVDGIHIGKVVIDVSVNLPSVVIRLAENIRKKVGNSLILPV